MPRISSGSWFFLMRARISGTGVSIPRLSRTQPARRIAKSVGSSSASTRVSQVQIIFRPRATMPSQISRARFLLDVKVSSFTATRGTPAATVRSSMSRVYSTEWKRRRTPHVVLLPQ